MRLKLPVWHAAGAISMLLRPLQGGHADLSLLRSPDLGPHYDNALCQMANLLRAIGSAITDTGPRAFKQADDAVAAMDTAWFSLLDVMAPKLLSNPLQRGALEVRLISSLLYVLGTRVRAAYVALPAALAARDPTAAALAAARLQAYPGWIRSGDKLRDPFRGVDNMMASFTARLNRVSPAREEWILSLDSSDMHRRDSLLWWRPSPSVPHLVQVSFIVCFRVLVIFLGVGFCIIDGRNLPLVREHDLDIPNTLCLIDCR
jgi:hypothetical protein